MEENIKEYLKSINDYNYTSTAGATVFTIKTSDSDLYKMIEKQQKQINELAKAVEMLLETKIKNNE